MILKLAKFFVFLFLILSLIIFLLYPSDIKNTLFLVFDLWLSKVVVSLVPFFILSSILQNYPFISKFSYPLLTKIFHFENQKSCSLFLMSLICGNPTSSFLVINALNNQEISLNEGNRLLRGTVLSSPLFTITMFKELGIFVFLTQIIVSMLFLVLTKTKCENSFFKKPHFDAFDLIENTPKVMFEILSSMVIVALLKVVLCKIFVFKFNGLIPFSYVFDILELTTGLDSILNYNLSLRYKYVLMSFLHSFGGITIIVQILYNIKKTHLSKTSLVGFRILHGIITSIIIFIISLFFPLKQV